MPQDQQKINVDNVVRYLNRAFAEAMHTASAKIGSKATRTVSKGKARGYLGELSGPGGS